MIEALNKRREAAGDEGFTLIELLIAIVVVGILAAVVIVGIGGLTNSGSKSACTASKDAATAGAVVFYANSPTHAYPANFGEMTTAVAPAQPVLIANGTTPNAAPETLGAVTYAAGMVLEHGADWQLGMTVGAAGAAPSFTCYP